MDYIQTPFQHFSHLPNHDHLVPNMATGSYNNHQHVLHGYPLSHQPNMMNMPNVQKPNETKPRLGKEEVDVLEREFKRNPKPTTQTKRMFAEEMGVDLSRINNWFQNRRAKRKQEKKTEAYEAGQAREAAMGYSVSAPATPDFTQSNYNGEYQMMPQQSSSMSFPTTGPPPATAPYNPQYEDPTTASLESLSRTIAAAQAASQSGEFSGGFPLHHNEAHHLADMQGMAEQSDLDRAQFPTNVNVNYSSFADPTFNFQPQFNTNGFHEPEPLGSFAIAESGHTPTAFNTYPDANNTRSFSTTSIPSQGFPHSFTDVLSLRPQDSIDNQASDHSNEATPSLAPSIDWQLLSPKNGSSPSPPPASSLFKSPPPPTDLAARRKKVQVKPAALGTGTMRGRPSVGPRTMSNIDGFRRQVASPLISSPMRRIVSAGGNGNRNILTGRIQKPGTESAQRSPINIKGFETVWMEHHYGMMSHPSLTASSSLTSSLAPPTPMSPGERRMTLKGENSLSNESELSLLFNVQHNNNNLPTFIDSNQVTDQTPPETPQNSLGLQPTPTSGWPGGTEHHNTEQHWNYEISDDPHYTPNRDTFATDLSMPQSSFSSQPVTPAFGSFNQGGFLSGNAHDSPQFNSTSPLYTLSNQGGSAEYSFPHDGLQHFPHVAMVSSSPTMMTKQKQYQFSNVTPADYLEK